MVVDPLRHLDVFSPDKWGTKTIDVIGAGATGSHLVDTIVNLGVSCRVWDFDTVAEHNVGNQTYGISDIGRLKLDALEEYAYTKTGIRITKRNEEVDGSQRLGQFVFLLTDTMASRKTIFEGSLRRNLGVKYMVETRMGADEGRIYALNPNLPSHIKEWEATLYSDDEAETSMCGASTSVGATAKIIANIAVWQMIRWFSIQNGEASADEQIENEIIVTLRPMEMHSRMFLTT